MLRARELPLRGVLGFVIHSRAVRFDDGVIDDVGVLAYGIGKPGVAPDYRLGGGLVLRGGRLTVAALQRPLRDLAGPLTITDDALASTDLRGTLGGLPVAGRGALYGLFGEPAFRLGLRGDGDLSRLRSLFAFSEKLPLRGPIHLETLLASSLAKPLIRSVFAGQGIAYDRFPIAALDGVADVYDGNVVVQGVRARYGATDVAVGGRIVFNRDNTSDIDFALERGRAGRLAAVHRRDRARRGHRRDGADRPAPGAKGLHRARHDRGQRAERRARGRSRSTSRAWASSARSTSAGPTARRWPAASSCSGRSRRARAGCTCAASAWPTCTAAAAAGRGHAGAAAGGGRDRRRSGRRGQPGQLRPGRDAAGARPAVRDPMCWARGSVRVGGTFSDLRLAEIRVDGPLGRLRGEGAYAGGCSRWRAVRRLVAALRPFIGETGYLAAGCTVRCA